MQVPPQRVWTKDRLRSCLLALAGLGLCHSISLSNGFVDFDDPVVFLNNELIKGSNPFSLFDLSRTDWRPVRDVSHWLDYRIHQNNALLCHAHNLFFLLTSAGAFAFFLTALGAPSRTVAFSTFLGFIHPCQIESIAWISGRKDLLAATFGFLAMGVAYRALTQKSRPSNILTVLLLTAAGIMSKGHLVVMPGVIISLMLYASWRGKLQVNPMSVGLFASVLVLCTAFVPRIMTGSVLLESGPRELDAPTLLFSDIVQLPLRYSVNLIWPSQLNHIYLTSALGLKYSLMSWCSTGLVCLIMLMLILLWRRRDITLPLLLIVLALMVPYFHLKTGTVYMADRYLFMPIPILVFAGVLVAQRRQWSMKRQCLLLSCVTMAWLAMGLPQQLAWRNSVNLWSRMTEVYPTHDWGYRRLGLAWFREGNSSEAQTSWETAVALNPRDTRSMNNLGVLLMRRGDWRNAKQWIEKVLAIDPKDPIATANLKLLDENHAP